MFRPGEHGGIFVRETNKLAMLSVDTCLSTLGATCHELLCIWWNETVSSFPTEVVCRVGCGGEQGMRATITSVIDNCHHLEADWGGTDGWLKIEDLITEGLDVLDQCLIRHPFLIVGGRYIERGGCQNIIWGRHTSTHHEGSIGSRCTRVEDQCGIWQDWESVLIIEIV
jgi:hypothetical protein